jgi:hypothetical protein
MLDVHYIRRSYEKMGKRVAVEQLTVRLLQHSLSILQANFLSERRRRL